MVFTGKAKRMPDHGHSRERRLPEQDSTRRRNPGFTLIEVLISLVIGMVVLAALYAVFTIQNKNFAKQEQIGEMQQIARTAMDSMAREITMAGYDPNKSLPTPAPADAAITAAGTTSLSFTSDLNGDGDTLDANENVTYAFDSANSRITRNTGGGGQPFSENIQGLTFTYYNAAGGVPATLADIRRIQISITARTAKPDPANGYRTYTLTSFVTPRNLSM